MQKIEKHYLDSPIENLTFDCTVRLGGRELDMIRYALLCLAKSPGASDEKTYAMELYNEFLTKC